MNTATVQITNKNFNLGLKTVKRLGGKYDPNTKTWQVRSNADELNAPGLYSLRIVAPTTSPANTWQGQASMDHPDSIF